MFTVEHWNFHFSGIIMECKLIFSWKMNSHNVILHIVHFFIVLDVVQQTYLNDNDTIMAITCVKWQCNLLLNSNWLLCLSILQLFSWIGLLMINHTSIHEIDGWQTSGSTSCHDNYIGLATLKRCYQLPNLPQYPNFWDYGSLTTAYVIPLHKKPSIIVPIYH